MRKSSVLLISIGLVVLGVALPHTQPEAGALTVPAGGDLQAAIDGARPGDTIFLDPGATYVGNFVLHARQSSDTRPTVLRTSGP